MYLGSVRFFKHLILLATLVLVIIPIVVSLFLMFRVGLLNREVKLLRSDLETAQSYNAQGDLMARLHGGGAGAEALNVSELALLFERNNISMEQILTAYGEDGVAAPSVSSAEKSAPRESADLAYQSMYPDMIVSRSGEQVYTEKTMYLTFDDGPSELTPEFLNLLAEHDIKATFFVTGWMGARTQEYLKQIHECGHTLGIHSYSHKYSQIYSSVEAFLDDFYLMYRLVCDATGEPPEIFRFAGGSINAYNYGIYKEIIAEMQRRGFTYYDWNVSGMDAADRVTAEKIAENVKTSAYGKKRGIVLLHDSTGKRSTLQALPEIIKTLSEAGYSFDKLTNSVKPITFGYIN